MNLYKRNQTKSFICIVCSNVAYLVGTEFTVAIET